MKLENLGIGARLALGFGAMLLLLAATVAFNAWQFDRLRDEVAAMVDEDAAKLRLTQDVLQLARSNGLLVFTLMSTDDAAQRQALRAEVAQVRQAIDERMAGLDRLVRKPEARALLAEFGGARKAWVQGFSASLELLAAGQAEAARRDFLAQALPRLRAMEAPAQKLAEFQMQVLDATRRRVDRDLRRAMAWLLGLSLGAGLLALLAARALARSITQPLAHAVDASQRVAGGDLSQAIEARGQNETGRLLAAMQRMQQGLAGTVHSVRGNAESVASASAQIAQGNNDLSRRTEQQAAALQQTAATMSQLDTTVRSTAEHAEQARTLAQAANRAATGGGGLVGQVVGAMGEIRSGSQRIAEIIGTIDAIAFQTNILALNAAVEAARAGEQGRGFAVVAGEVRMLAQRSAEAAREIKDLIGASVAQVERGSTLVDGAGRAMDEIVQAIGRVAAVVSEISAACREQADGIGQASQAVTQMDQATQQNAALVEQSAAAAESLRQQAEALLGAVASFRLANA